MSPVALAWQQFRFERKLFWRNPSAAFFNFVLPLLLLVLVGAVFVGDADELDVLIPGIAGMSVMATTFTALAFNLTYPARAGHPQARARHADAGRSYLGGMIGSAVLNAFAPGGARGGDRQRRSTASTGPQRLAARWSGSPRSGVVCFGSLGVAFSHAIPNVDSAPAYVNAVFLPLIFISGVFYSSDDLPGVLEGDRRGAAAQAPDRRPLRGDRGRRRGRRAWPRRWWRGWTAGRRCCWPCASSAGSRPRLERAGACPWRRSQRSCSRQSGQRSRAAPRSAREWSCTSRWATSCSTT